jgi:hypothetical protein
MKTLQINEQTAREIFPKASEEFKEVLKDTFGEKFFQRKITDRVKSFEDACGILGFIVQTHRNMFEELQKDEIAYIKLKVITEALNEGWEPDWNNNNEYKYYPWWNMQNGFSLSDVSYYYSYSFVSSRLCFKSRELAEYAAKQFLEIYKDYFTI